MSELRTFVQRLDDWQEDRRPPGRADDIVRGAEALVSAGKMDGVPAVEWHRYLQLTGDHHFLRALADDALRRRWAETAFAAIRHSDYGLRELFARRLVDNPEAIYFREPGPDGDNRWTFRRTWEQARAMAAVFHRLEAGGPRVAILADNSLESACADLACLLFDILVTPLNVHEDADTLGWIFDRLGINIVLTDSEERLRRLETVRRHTGREFRILLLRNRGGAGAEPLAGLTAATGTDDIDAILDGRSRFSLEQPATVMFTSGSTGTPKGVVFSIANLVTKRFARAAALPDVGDREVLLCYLPLYHTFGRFLEMLGMLYWGGTYVFLGNPSTGTLRARMPEVEPTGFISVPVRWVQLHQDALRRMDDEPDEVKQEQAFRQIVGRRLRWGLSAAGHLDPAVFRFFNRMGVALCSGFGMTEATGGITMTPPGRYVPDTVGVPLPGARIRLSSRGELQVAGPYIARYLDDTALTPGVEPAADDAEWWFATGDLFRARDDGYLEIVDRLKDIYKNSKGQTVAPQRVESKFRGVPGIRRTFLVGDGRAHNVLLIVPDPDDPVIRAMASPGDVEEYFHQLVTAANQDLAPYERVVNFAVLERDFELERDELTLKGSFRRKVIREHFAETIDRLYQRRYVELSEGGCRVRLPRWVFRDLGILESDLVLGVGRLVNRVTGQILAFQPNPPRCRCRIGDLEYRLTEDVVDFGALVHQPRLWLGNRALTAFFPCKEGWESHLGTFSERVYRPVDPVVDPPVGDGSDGIRAAYIRDEQLIDLHRLIHRALAADSQVARTAVSELGNRLRQVDDQVGAVIRRRLEALADHPDEEVRCLAYRTLLLDDPLPEYNEVFPAFLESGRSFLNAASIEAIASSNLNQRRFAALRRRLYHYRATLEWPATESIRQRFEDVFRLLVDFVRHHPEYYYPVRAELACWTMFNDDPGLAGRAEEQLRQLFAWFDTLLSREAPAPDPELWQSRLVFEDSLGSEERARLSVVLSETTFLAESIRLVFDVPDFDPRRIRPGGLWVSRILSRSGYILCYVGINMDTAEHYDLMVILHDDLGDPRLYRTILGLIAISGHPEGIPVLPRFGCFRPDLGAISLLHIDDLSAWDRIREMAVRHSRDVEVPARDDWRKIFVTALAAFFAGWRHSDGRIVPGAVSPANVTVPEPDYREGAVILSLSGWYAYRDTLSLVRPMIRNFFRQTLAHFPWVEASLDPTWIADAALDVLGPESGRKWLEELRGDLARAEAADLAIMLQPGLDRFLADMETRYHPPQVIRNAAGAYDRWRELNSEPTLAACTDFVSGLEQLYQLDRFPDLARFWLYRHTMFTGSDPLVRERFDELLAAMFRHPGRPATRLVELSDLQSALRTVEERTLLVQMVFPGGTVPRGMEVSAVGEGGGRHVVVSSRVIDQLGRAFTVSLPAGPAEIGQLYRLILREKYPRLFSETDHHLVLRDTHGRVAGGACYRFQSPEIVQLSYVVVSPPLRGVGIGSALLEDFCARMAAENVQVIKTPLFLQRFARSRGFRADPLWGGLVRFLSREH